MKIDLEKFICSLLEEYYFYPEPGEEFKSLINALKQQGLTYKNGKIVEVEPKQKWSEEDEYHKRQILRILKDNGCSQTLQERTEKWIKERLKSLKPQSQWKPSEEQMGGLLWVLENCAEKEGSSKMLSLANSIYDDLKKLRG